MKKFTVSEASMLLENGDKLNQVFGKEQTNLEDLVHYILRVCNQNKNRVRLRVRGLYDNVGFVLEIDFPLELNEDMQIIFDSDVCVDTGDYTERDFCANVWYGIGFASVRGAGRKTAGFGSDLYKDKEPVETKGDKGDKEDKEDVRSYNVGASDYAQHKIQPWDIYLDYNLNPWDADIVKRVLRTKKTDTRIMDYEKIIHTCKERIRQINLYGK
ncbi:hypothetical protein BV741P1_00031 [Phocaeicola phage BV741P1]|nr:hypothetical protein BV741P1_00031 [Phocaeicola phage BV741P1]